MPETMELTVEDQEAQGILEGEEYVDAINRCARWWDADFEAKQIIMEELEEMYKLYKSDHWSLRGEDGQVLRTPQQRRARPNCVENICFALVEGLVSEFSQDIDIVDYPVEPGDDATATMLTDLKEFIAYKNRIVRARENWLRNFFLYGTGIWHVYWDDEWSGGKGPNRWQGEVRWQSLHPSVVYPDARCRDSIHEGRRIHKAIWRTLEYAEERFPDQYENLIADTIRHDMFIGDEIPSETQESGEEQVLIIETWYLGKPLIKDDGEDTDETGMHVIWWAGEGNKQYLDHANYVYYDPNEDPTFPFMFSNCYPRENSVWGRGEAYFLKNPQIMRNKTAEIIMESHVHHAMGQTVYRETAVTPKQQRTIRDMGTLPGMWFPVRDIEGIKRLQGRNAPQSLIQEMDRNQKLQETTVGRFDISQGRTPGSVVAFRALDLLSARAQVRLRSKEKAMTTAYEEVGNYTNMLVEQFYTEQRAYRILGDDLDKTQYGIFSPDALRKVYSYELNASMPKDEFVGDGWAEIIAEDQYEEYCPQFDTICKVSSAMPTDRVFYMDMAKELYTAQLIDVETFWYVLDHGKFPPLKEIQQKMMMQQQAMQQQAMGDEGLAAMQGAEAGMPAGQQQGMPVGDHSPETLAKIEQAFRADPQLAREFASLPEPAQQMIIEQIIAQGV